MALLGWQCLQSTSCYASTALLLVDVVILQVCLRYSLRTGDDGGVLKTDVGVVVNY